MYRHFMVRPKNSPMPAKSTALSALSLALCRLRGLLSILPWLGRPAREQALLQHVRRKVFAPDDPDELVMTINDKQPSQPAGEANNVRWQPQLVGRSVIASDGVEMCWL